ncbi:MAG: phosphoglucosamine mutase [Epsilonproteobacteria bacterium]|nr:phosphoglucosamine mutase [Campylobacterota bacterium]
MKGLFGTDGIRGKANSYPMTPEIAFRLGRALAYYCNRKKGVTGGCRIIIGKDTRLSGYMLEHSLVGGITSIGAKALLVGPMPTPAMAFLVQSMRADAAIVISASHNPYEDNGLKLFSSHGTKFPYEVEEKLEELILQEKIDNIRAYGANIGKAYRIKDANGRYIVFAKSTFPQALSLSGLKIAIDCANGASYQIAPTIFGELGAEVSAYGISPDGTNINKDCGALYPENIAGKTIEKNADIGIAFDGDGDRAIFSDEEGNIVDGDMVMLILAKQMQKDGALKNNTVVATIMSNLGLEAGLREIGIELIRTDVGDRNVAIKMCQVGSYLGGEQSGHIILSELLPTGDGIITALALFSTMLKTGKKLSELTSNFHKFPQKIVSIDVKEKKPIKEMKQFGTAIADARRILKTGRIVFRYSGTENKARIMIEGDSRQLIDEICKNLISAIKREEICV